MKNVVIDAEVKIPEGLVIGEDPELDAKRFRRTERGICLITQPMINRLAELPSVHRAPKRELPSIDAAKETPAIETLAIEDPAIEDHASNGLAPDASVSELKDEVATSGLKA